jgi:glycosyltransferase involved in cell wall biosynthesis
MRGPICVDHRRVDRSDGTGAASYRDCLATGVAAAGFILQELTDTAPGIASYATRTWRRITALNPFPRRAAICPLAQGHDSYVARDVFRQAQIHFDAYGRYLQLRSASPPRLVHWSYPLPLHFAGTINLYSVLDLIPLLQPELTPIRPQRAARLLHRLRREATHLVTISDASRREIVATLGWPEDRVTNTYLAVDPQPGTPGEVAASLHALGLQWGGYFLHAGTIERRKNIGRLIEAYRASGSVRALLLVGPDGWNHADELRPAMGLMVPSGAARPGPCILRLPWMDRAMLTHLMQGAAAVLAPSLAEGFGLPPIEAMALGTPGLIGTVPAMQEVAGGAALVVDGRDVRMLAAAIQRLDQDAELRATLVQRGTVRARMFSPAAYADRLCRLYSQVMPHSG